MAKTFVGIGEGVRPAAGEPDATPFPPRALGVFRVGPRWPHLLVAWVW